MSKDLPGQGDVIEATPLFQETVRFWQDRLGDRVPAEWALMPIFVKEYFEEVLRLQTVRCSASVSTVLLLERLGP